MLTRLTNKPIYIADNINGRADVAIGNDVYGDRVGPCLRASRFGGRVSLTIDARDVLPDVASEKLVMVGDVAAIETEQVRLDAGSSKGERHRWYLKDDGIEWEILWDKLSDVPISGAVKFDLGFPDGLDFHYQPALSAEEIDDGATRPENVVGSIAVYWKQAGRYLRGEKEIVNFETGKFCHIYRPEVIDANGERAWCQWIYTQGRLTAMLPMDWMRAAAYPVILDPEFGYTSQGDTPSNANLHANAHNNTYVHSGTTGETVTDVTVYRSFTFAGGGQAHCALYDFAAGVPGNRLTAQLNPPIGTGWWTQSGLSISLSTGTDYSLAIYTASSVRDFFYDDTGGTETRFADHTSGLTDPWTDTSASSQNRVFSIYATFTAAPSGGIIRKLVGEGGLVGQGGLVG